VTNAMSDSQTTNDALAAQIIDYLSNTPDFFKDKPELLASMNFEHVGAGTVSLVERQVAVLRDRNAELRRRLDLLTHRAQQNEALLATTQAVIASIASLNTRSELAPTFVALTKKHFDIDHAGFFWLDESLIEDTRKTLDHLIGNRESCSGPARQNEMQALFQDIDVEGSVALARVTKDGKPIAMIAVGSTDVTRYGINDGTLFLDYLASVIACLPVSTAVEM
tara:strand:- start:1577 stop:2245 length:669 start_codon:yes stop_codon:yes gene_type:complete